MRDLGQGTVTSQARFSNLNKINIKWTHANNEQISYTHLDLPSLILFMLYKGLYDRLMCPVCDVTAWAREGMQYPGPGKEPTIGMYVAPKPFDKKT